ncbi:MAG: hypothetical protein HOA08_20945 [Rhodospirillaceae bacterium]|nr:hypothetical protein [Rhodospirillaceae bacterium]MBT3491417.1 hypothetical protein [Rhodospirillaceae bacterium]MBT3782579.1 hypothetical protein [Rhodospirillaceae bacterium]MBT3974948.1 hypothetical protein [Rhodospirillaceae bacterium]MBT4170137.1 hypothetical protein [Rhodospirillaceae bacterium]
MSKTTFGITPGRTPGRTLMAAMLLLTACAAEAVWEKPGGSPAIFDQDTAACFRGASIQAKMQIDKRGGSVAPQIELRAGAGRVRDLSASTREAISLEEKAIRGKLYSRCMHRLGYRLAKPE